MCEQCRLRSRTNAKRRSEKVRLIDNSSLAPATLHNICALSWCGMLIPLPSNHEICKSCRSFAARVVKIKTTSVGNQDDDAGLKSLDKAAIRKMARSHYRATTSSLPVSLLLIHRLLQLELTRRFSILLHSNIIQHSSRRYNPYSPIF